MTLDKEVKMKIIKKLQTIFSAGKENGEEKNHAKAPDGGNNSVKKNIYKNDISFNYSNDSKFDADTRLVMTAQMFYGKNGYYPDIKNPKTFCEKALWLKLMYSDERITRCCDKYKVKSYIGEVLGEGYTVPVLRRYDSVFDIDPDELPDKFVLKVSWCTGYNIIVSDKSEINLDEIRAKLDYWCLPWKSSYYGSFNWGYKNAEPVVFAEEYIDISGSSTEYKVFCFNGKVRFTLVEADYFGENPKRGYYSRNWEEEPFQLGNTEKKQFRKPAAYEEMLEISEKLAEPFPYVRVDFYNVSGRLYVGEMTFYSGGGFSRVIPRSYDEVLGRDLDLTEAMKRVNYTG